MLPATRRRCGQRELGRGEGTAWTGAVRGCSGVVEGAPAERDKVWGMVYGGMVWEIEG